MAGLNFYYIKDILVTFYQFLSEKSKQTIYLTIYDLHIIWSYLNLLQSYNLDIANLTVYYQILNRYFAEKKDILNLQGIIDVLSTFVVNEIRMFS
jgi:hypothetical protein